MWYLGTDLGDKEGKLGLGSLGEMDDYMFNAHVNGCKYVHEATTYLEIFNYSVRLELQVAGAIFWLTTFCRIQP